MEGWGGVGGVERGFLLKSKTDSLGKILTSCKKQRYPRAQLQGLIKPLSPSRPPRHSHVGPGGEVTTGWLSSKAPPPPPPPLQGHSDPPPPEKAPTPRQCLTAEDHGSRGAHDGEKGGILGRSRSSSSSVSRHGGGVQPAVRVRKGGREGREAGLCYVGTERRWHNSDGHQPGALSTSTATAALGSSAWLGLLQFSVLE